jgi:hypothetical protein
MIYSRSVIRRLTPGMWRRRQDRICPVSRPVNAAGRHPVAASAWRVPVRWHGPVSFTSVHVGDPFAVAVPGREHRPYSSSSPPGKRVRASLLTGCWRSTGAPVQRCSRPAGIPLDGVSFTSWMTSARWRAASTWAGCTGGDAHPLGDGEGRRVFTAARRFCAAVLTAQSAVTTSAPALGINPAAGCGCRKPMPPGDIHESRLRRGRAAGRGSGPGR